MASISSKVRSRLVDGVSLGSVAVMTLIVVIVGVGLALRLINITTLPSGLHGDEAIVGLEGQRVLREGLVDPYSPSALGQPAVPFYLSALLVYLFDNTILAVRLFAVLIGTLTIAALYVVVRRSLDLPTALLASTFLAVMGWHIFYSRIAFPLPSWPLWVVLTAGVIAHAARGRSPLWWTAAGAMAGAGVYTYNAYPLTFATIVLFAAYTLVLGCWPLTRATTKAGFGFFLGTLVALLPMIWFAARNPDLYFGRFRGQSARRSEEWQALDGPYDYASHIVTEYFGFWRRLCCNPVQDSTDGSGITETIPLVLLIVAIAGLVIGAIRYRSPLVRFGIMIVVLSPLATVLTEGAEIRRTLVIAPFLAMFSAIAVVEVIRFASQSRLPLLSPATVLACGLLLSVGVVTDLRNYYSTFADSSYQRWVFVEALTDASFYMDELDEGDYVYFYADRWSINYETRRFLAPDVEGENRSVEFGEFSLDVDPENGRPVFVLIGDYRELIDEIRERYPDGRITAGGDGDRTTFIGYEVLDHESGSTAPDTN
jgi:hypothetical protein